VTSVSTSTRSRIGKRGVLVQEMGVLGKGAVHVTAREHHQAFHAVADAVIEQLLGARHVDVVSLALIGAKVLDETHVNHADGPFSADHVFESLLSQVDHVGANSPRVPLPSGPIDTTNLEALLEAAGQEPPLTSCDARDQNFFHLYSEDLRLRYRIIEVCQPLPETAVLG